MTKAVIALGLLLAVAMPAPALAQSAGDDQYVDPFQPGGGGVDDDRGGGDGNSGDQGGGSTGGDTGTTTPSEPAVDPAGEGAGSVAEGGNGTALPRTGLAVAPVVLMGLLLLGGGVTLRRRV